MSERHVVDKFGRRYVLSVGMTMELVRINLTAGYTPIGYANLILHLPEKLDLADIRIRPQYQRRGLGTVLLHEILRLAKEQGVLIIHGFVVQSDLESNPQLLEWYRHNGFVVETATDEDRALPFHEDAVAMLRFRLA